jgi:hypothetical protein
MWQAQGYEKEEDETQMAQKREKEDFPAQTWA